MAETYNLNYSKKLPKNKDIFINRNTLFKETLKYLKVKDSDRVLEVGCDKGEFVNFFQKRLGKNSAMGLDLNKEAISSSKIQNLFCMDATETKFPDKYFDKIYSFHVIEHIPDLHKFFREMDRILNDKGIIVLGYPCEIFRGMLSVRQAIKATGNPFDARKLHIHKLNPRKIKRYIRGTRLKYVRSKLMFALLPQYITVLRK